MEPGKLTNAAALLMKMIWRSFRWAFGFEEDVLSSSVQILKIDLAAYAEE